MNSMKKMIFDFIFFNQNYCYVCKDEKTENLICSSCLERLDFIDGNFLVDNNRVYYPLFYNNYIKEIIREFKFHKKTYLVKPLAAILFKYISQKEELKDIDYVSFIPMEQRALFDRGFNQVQLLANELADLLDVEVISLIEKNKKTREQNKVSLTQRKENIKNSFRPIDDCNIDGKTILLIDDLVTTGNTLREASQTILINNKVNIKFLTITSSRIGEDDD